MSVWSPVHCDTSSVIHISDINVHILLQTSLHICPSFYHSIRSTVNTDQAFFSFLSPNLSFISYFSCCLLPFSSFLNHFSHLSEFWKELDAYTMLMLTGLLLGTGFSMRLCALYWTAGFPCKYAKYDVWNWKNWMDIKYPSILSILYKGLSVKFQLPLFVVHQNNLNHLQKSSTHCHWKPTVN